jgi:CheY-like chemotaxis protein
MPRLLLVDDNPSIHKIAETLLAASDVQLISCGSGAQAMALVNQGDHFDVALLDTSMLGMDGWALLQQLRETESTARMPVAMMAGVLDIVDPEKLRLAPIQGFLKKPVELRDLGDRVKRLMETPVPAPAPPPPAPEAAITGTFLTQPSMLVPDEFKLPAGDDDLLLLGPEDLWPETPEDAAEAPHALDAEDVQEIPQALRETADAAHAPEPEPLDLEELDLEGLQGLTFPTSAMPALDEPEAAAPAEPAPPEAPAPATVREDVPEFLLADTLPEAPLEASVAFADQLPDLGPALDQPIGTGASAVSPTNLLELGEPIDWSDDSDTLVGMALGAPEASAFPLEAEPPAFAETPLATLPEVITLSDILDPPPAPSAPAEPHTGLTESWLPEFAEEAAEPLPAAELQAAAEAVPDPLAGLLADPVLMDRLAKALVARLGDQVLREIAWEVMPELAARVRQQAAP